MAAGMFLTFGIVVARIGSEYSRLRPTVFPITFVTLDVLALAAQVIGGVSASATFQAGTSATKGAYVMHIGIFIQLCKGRCCSA
ncbi:hypothetical protein FRB97_008853 [Tulasnella sp. 331]|nr:hypothetical protein FRB97_008853 [Tulasnella sp. 331]